MTADCKQCRAKNEEGVQCGRKASCKVGCRYYCWQHSKSYEKGKGCVRKPRDSTKKSTGKATKKKEKVVVCKQCRAKNEQGVQCGRKASCKVGCRYYCWQHSRSYEKGKGCVRKPRGTVKAEELPLGGTVLDELIIPEADISIPSGRQIQLYKPKRSSASRPRPTGTFKIEEISEGGTVLDELIAIPRSKSKRSTGEDAWEDYIFGGSYVEPKRRAVRRPKSIEKEEVGGGGGGWFTGIFGE